MSETHKACFLPGVEEKKSKFYYNSRINQAWPEQYKMEFLDKTLQLILETLSEVFFLSGPLLPHH